MTRIDRRAFLFSASLGAVGAAPVYRALASDAERSLAAGQARFREPFLRLCDALCPVLDTSRPAPFYQDSYAVRGLAVAYDMTGKAKYLDACRRWSTKMVQHQAEMIPPGAYDINYGRKPGADHGNWFVADSSSIAMAVQATAVRCGDAAEKARYFASVRAFARLVMDNYVRPSGGITDGLWSSFDGEWWCSTGIFGSLAFLLYDQTADPAYLKVGQGAIDWLNRQRFENSAHISFKEAAPAVMMYVFEAYSAGMPHLKADPPRWRASLVEVRRALDWMAAHQEGRGGKSAWKYNSQWGCKLGGLPFQMYVWSRYLPEGSQITAAADQELDCLTRLLSVDPSKQFQLAVFSMVSYAERLSPGALYRTSRNMVPAPRG
jgi:hypothetical protein